MVFKKGLLLNKSREFSGGGRGRRRQSKVEDQEQKK